MYAVINHHKLLSIRYACSSLICILL